MKKIFLLSVLLLTVLVVNAQRGELKWNKVMAKGTPSTYAGWDSEGNPAELTVPSETDPVYSASSWFSTTNNSANWNTAFGWGNHASAGYQPLLVSGTNIKTINSTSLVGSGNVSVQPTLVSGTNIKTINSTSLLGSGNISVLTSETDPVYSASSWFSTTNNSANWNTAFGWGNHASAGYITNSAANFELMRSDGTNAGASGLASFSTGNLWLGLSTTTGSNRTIQADGSSATINLNLTAKGGNVNVNGNSFDPSGNVTYNVGGNTQTTTVSGTNGNISMVLRPKGNGYVRLSASTGFNGIYVAGDDGRVDITPIDNASYSLKINNVGTLSNSTIYPLVLEGESNVMGTGFNTNLKFQFRKDIQFFQGVNLRADVADITSTSENVDFSIHLLNDGIMQEKFLIKSNGDVTIKTLRTNCTGATSGTIYNDAGFLKVCP